MKQAKYIYLFLVGFLLAGPMVRAQVYYVKATASGTGTGASWANAAGASQLQTIINAAASGSQVWVQGSTSGITYYPTTGASRTVSFTLKSGVSVYGGFVGTETLVSQAQPTTYISILSGDIGTVGNNTDNTYNVVVSSGNTGTTILSGFTIANGNANGSGQNSTGGGIYNSGTTVIYSHDIIQSNTAISNGGGVFITGAGNVTFDTCTFSSNSTTVASGTTNGGGGLFNTGGTANLVGCTFTSNTSSSEGGGVFGYNSSILNLTNCTFTGNVASGDGGGIGNGASAAYLTGCTFTSNISNGTTVNNGGGGAYNNSGTGMQMTNCVFTNNTAFSTGGGLFTYNGDALPLTSCLFTSNNANNGGGIGSVGGTSIVVYNSKLSNNVATVSGGGLFTSGVGAGILQTDTFLTNTANDTAYHTSPIAGGGICNTAASNVVLTHSLVQGNIATQGDGGGEYNYNNANNNDSSDIFLGNVSNNGNGGGLVDSAGNTKYFKCVFADNQCAQYGGGAYISNNSGELESCTFFNNQANSAGGYGDGAYFNNAPNCKFYGNMVWSRTGTSVGLVGAPNTSKIKDNDIINGTLYNGSNGNIMTTPTFGSSGSVSGYVGTDGMWATADDGLHLVNGSNGTDAVPSGMYFNVTDITEAARPDAGGTMADMGAYEGPGSFVALSVELLCFTGTPVGDHTVNLGWNVAGGGAAAQFVVERSVDGKGFQAVGTVNAAGQSNYSFVDNYGVGLVIAYRLLILQVDGSQVYSGTVVVSHVETGQASLRPSVVHGATTLYVTSSQATSSGVMVLDGSGHVLYSRSIVLSPGDNYIQLDMSGFARGVYYVHIGGRTLRLEKL